jgi:hypothetical protein
MASELSASADAHAGFSQNLGFIFIGIPSFLDHHRRAARDSHTGVISRMKIQCSNENPRSRGFEARTTAAGD